MDSSLQPVSKLMAPIINPLKSTKAFQLFYQYMVSGVIDAGIEEDGGVKCYNQIPKLYHTSVIILGTILSLFVLYRYWPILKQNWHSKQPQATTAKSFIMRTVDVLASLSGFGVLIFIMYIKIQTKKGLFILNPCHMTLLVQSYLLIASKTEFNKAVHLCYISSVYGAVIALIFPHTNGILPIELFLYYFQHYLITPVGVILLYRHYGYPKITLKNHVVSFTATCLYQYSVLGPFSIMTMVNLNFILCHTPVDVGFWLYDYHYVVVGVPVLAIYSLVSRYLFLLMFVLWDFTKRIFKIKRQ